MTVVAFDTETWRHQPGLQAPPLVCVSLWEDKDGRRRGTVLGREDGLRWARRTFADSDITLVGHNVAYDLAVLLAADFDLGPLLFKACADGRVRCTMLREQFLANAEGQLHKKKDVVGPKYGPVKPYSLAGCAWEHLKHDISEGKIEGSWKLRFKELDGIPPENWPPEPYAYALGDARETLEVFFKQEEVGRAATVRVNAESCGWVASEADKKFRKTISPARVLNIFHDEPAQVRAAFALRLMECWGVQTDGEAVAALEEALLAEIAALEPELLAAGLKRTKKDGTPGTMDQKALKAAIDAAYAKQGLKAKDTPKRGTSTSAEVLLASGDDLLVRYGKSSLTRKILSTYIPLMKTGVVLPIHPSFQVLMESGRTSCREPNLQNPPRKGAVRACFVPRPGHVFLACDYDTAELRSLAQACLDLLGRSTLADWYNRDPEFDPHTLLASGLMGISYEEAMALKKAGDKVLKHHRQMAKSANFGFPGGLGARTFVSYAKDSGVDITEKQAKDLREAWFARWAQMRDYFKTIEHMMAESGEGTILQYRSLRVRGGTRYTAACNTFFQGPVADGAKIALFYVARECYADPESSLYGCRPVLFLHDEIILEVPEERLDMAAKCLSGLMEAALRIILPDVPVRTSVSAMRRWYKDAEAVYIDGHLVPWEPKVEERKVA